ncbi:exported hypothetical protein [Vibrio nigripulchritudo SO65]|uniref:hypothetical protein n=1 Tax=Vibrio nigripulchritudo TaxID=28173 RepID=UPI0003B1D540|nr:hypothetical protein [Vibrio nigripulchritudo]CCN35893.1 exported hypothetical protein [Vibrio nigripulchritudo AM115]CCN39290.1 exported hypothetical protein [Vibrio nigripulchritudo FTn2]CCN64841.1 exported hypothetical protein [Vibrio nigripulchritudo POn4]CCN79131.1 exported hypothetical protein [Vibrio nigripulchritudo SO65]
MKKALLSLFAVSVLAGCQSNNLTEANGNGAVLFPITIDYKSVFNYPCRSISFELNNEEFSFNIDVDKQEDLLGGYERHFGYGLISDIPPGDYLISEVHCYAHSGRVFNGSKSYITFRALLDFKIEPNTITVDNSGIAGEAIQESDGTRSFDFSWSEQTDEFQSRAIELLRNTQENISDWSIVKE